MMKKSLCAGIILVICLLSACGGKKQENTVPYYKDGHYSAEAVPEEIGGIIRLDITVSGGKIAAVEMQNLDKDGSEKGKEYGKASEGATNPGLYRIAQASVENTAKFPEMLIAAQTPDGVDSISGATLSHDAFVQAAREALKAAE